MKNVRMVLRWVAIAIAVWVGFTGAAGVVAGEWALHPGRRALGPRDETAARAIAERNGAPLEEISVSAEDGAVLRAWKIRPANGNGNAVILLHGQSDNRAGMLGYAEMLLRHGYAVLLPDARAHGASGGALATYGVKEASDVRRWFDWVERNDGPRCVYGLGESMGAAQLLQSLRTTPGFCAVVAESSFASFREASYDRLGQELHAGPWAGRTLLRPAFEAGFLYARWRYGVALEQASPEEAVAGSNVPVLLIHGLRDTNLPPRHSERILESSVSRAAGVELWEPAEAGHTGAAGAEPKEFERRVVGWFKGHPGR
jgi:dipeptidyl aminopeptidase/acylaminoacyl peptidase